MAMCHCGTPEIPSGEAGLKAKLLPGEQEVYDRYFQEKVHYNRLRGRYVYGPALYFPVIYQLAAQRQQKKHYVFHLHTGKADFHKRQMRTDL